MDSGSVRHILACFVLLAGCTWLFFGRLDCLIQCFIVLSFFTHAFGALQNSSSCFCGMGKLEQNLAFRGKVRVEGRCLWDPLCSRETWDLGEMCPPLPSHCSASTSWWFSRGSPGRADSAVGTKLPPHQKLLYQTSWPCSAFLSLPYKFTDPKTPAFLSEIM